MMHKPTVFVVDDDSAVLDSLRWLLESVNLNVETYDSAEAFLQNYSIYRIGCLVADIRMPGMSGLQLQQKLKAHKYALPIIFVTGHGDIPMAVRAMKYGAADFIEKPFNDQDLLDRTQAALEKDKINHQYRKRYETIRARMANLTRRERQVLDLVVHQNANKKIAGDLGVSIKTIEFHRARVMEKMHADSLLDLAEMAREVRPSSEDPAHPPL
ncbi:MAG TPA: response regulator transcription factor [Gammaproteobacteria bacterium]|nr:response regulator transcription factor [Gammaproteobacteria bacterium]